MYIGVDFDNTIVSYDELFWRAATEQGLMVEETPHTKLAIRDGLRAQGGEAAWIALQARVYGPLIREAPIFAGVLEFFATCSTLGVPTVIISHKTRVAGDAVYDLHQAARSWLTAQGLGVPAHFEVTRAAKLKRIELEGCTHFIDDLPEVLADPGFPAGVEPILFDPFVQHGVSAQFKHMTSWVEMQDLVVSAATPK